MQNAPNSQRRPNHHPMRKYDEKRFLSESLGKKLKITTLDNHDKINGTLLGWDKYHIIVMTESGPVMLFKHVLHNIMREDKRRPQ